MTAAADPSSSPRQPNAAAARQAWREMPVRIAALVTTGVVLVVLVVGVRTLVQGIRDRALIQSGTRVEAMLEWMDGASRAADRTVKRKVRLSYVLPTDPPDSSRRLLEGTLSPIPGQLTSGQTIIPIYIDPNDLTRWTDRVDPPSWLRAMTVPLLLSPIALAMIGLTLWQRSRVLRLYRNGTRSVANVVEVHKTALVPSGKVMKVAPANGNGRVLSLVRPNSLGDAPARGQQVDVIVDNPNNPRRVLLAAAYGA